MNSRSNVYRALLSRHLSELAADGVAQCIASDLRWGEGPAYFAVHGLWVFSDIPNDRMLCWNEEQGLKIFRCPADFANGNSIAADGALITCEHGSRRLTRTTPDGDRNVICDAYNGRRLNSPNDLVEHPDGSIWFSDPTYGILSDVEGYRATPEQEANRVYRWDPATGTVTAQVASLKMPNGLCFSPDLKALFVADSGADMGPDVPFDEEGPREVYIFTVGEDGNAIEPGRIFARPRRGVPDGIRCDEQGYLWAGTGLGVECFNSDGAFVGAIETHEAVANLCFGGADGMQMLLTLATSAYVLTPARTA